jgi:hypothetical protein
MCFGAQRSGNQYLAQLIIILHRKLDQAQVNTKQNASYSPLGLPWFSSVTPGNCNDNTVQYVTTASSDFQSISIIHSQPVPFSPYPSFVLSQYLSVHIHYSLSPSPFQSISIIHSQPVPFTPWYTSLSFWELRYINSKTNTRLPFSLSYKIVLKHRSWKLRRTVTFSESTWQGNAGTWNAIYGCYPVTSLVNARVLM